MAVDSIYQLDDFLDIDTVEDPTKSPLQLWKGKRVAMIDPEDSVGQSRPKRQRRLTVKIAALQPFVLEEVEEVELDDLDEVTEVCD